MNPEEFNTLEKEVELGERVYLVAKRRVDGEDAEWSERKKILDAELYQLVLSFSKEDSGVQAAHILGKATMLARELMAPHNIVAAHERRLEELRFLRRQQAEYEQAKSSAQAAAANQSWR